MRIAVLHHFGRKIILSSLIGLIGSGFANASATETYPIAEGPFKPSWESLEENYQLPEWYRDAKFGIWAHWGPQCEPGQGDWYAKRIYQQDSAQNKYHVGHYGHPSKFGFKDVINEWKADEWDPELLFARYKRAGAKFFVAMANHHDNLDMYDSTYQPWNTVKMGPKEDIVGTWAKLARRAGLPFGVSVHAARSWSWYEDAQGSDKSGAFAGIAYDGKLTKADGKGTWWEGFDPQDLYAQNHLPGAPPDDAYVTKWFNRTKDLLDKYHPDLLYFDDGQLPLGAAGLSIAAHFYNSNRKRHDGKLEAVITSKDLSPAQQKAVVNDLERNMTPDLLKTVWQKDLCIGAWHYSEEVYKNGKYRKPRAMINLLVDVVSKNGTFLLNIPLRGDGTIDDKETDFLDEFTHWMDRNSECIYGTRPWTIYGEGPSVKNDGTAKDTTIAPRGIGPEFTANDLRFTTKGDVLYAIALGHPANGKFAIKALASLSPLYKEEIGKIQLLGASGSLQFVRDETGLTVALPELPASDYAVALKISPKK